eukprot:CAMPEP_0185847824 /NCGR_PEP_ID=MMETSP1354-20130828/2940_1 /TAXON_ID=708628 /ORGANISM="Erythrolobus madagascarensis, Strain CCMP3276" /LENGTH=231 /DNA_ID=CAMNT_0028548155 /DNA_START=510 /DNA_END=1205 /DNA_ORIENTATION=-
MDIMEGDTSGGVGDFGVVGVCGAEEGFEAVFRDGEANFPDMPSVVPSETGDDVATFFPFVDLGAFAHAESKSEKCEDDDDASADMIEIEVEQTTEAPTDSSEPAGKAACIEEDDLRGSTAMAARKMTPEERAVVLHKRKLRNRQSAKRSRARRLKTIGELSDAYDEIARDADTLRRKCELVVEQNKLLKEENTRLQETLELYRSALNQQKSSPGGNLDAGGLSGGNLAMAA